MVRYESPADFVPLARWIARGKLNGASGFGFSNEDLVQDGLCVLTRRWDDFDESRSARSTWAYSVLWRAMQDALRRYNPGGRWYRFEVFSLDAACGEDRTFLDGIGAEDEGFVRAEDLADPRLLRLTLALALLSERERDVITMRFFEDRLWEEIGAALGVTGSRGNQIAASAMRSLRAHLET